MNIRAREALMFIQISDASYLVCRSPGYIHTDIQTRGLKLTATQQIKLTVTLFCFLLRCRACFIFCCHAGLVFSLLCTSKMYCRSRFTRPNPQSSVLTGNWYRWYVSPTRAAKSNQGNPWTFSWTTHAGASASKHLQNIKNVVILDSVAMAVFVCPY